MVRVLGRSTPSRKPKPVDSAPAEPVETMRLPEPGRFMRSPRWQRTGGRADRHARRWAGPKSGEWP